MLPAREGQLGELPQTIKDAITVVCRLGYRYLWVDQCCISQGDDEEKQAQIGAMDRTYEQAEVVIVALGKNADAGLPGVSQKRQVRQPLVALSYMRLVTNMSHLSDILKKSTWSTRGWTYQEVLLARRGLFFTHEQVHFVCRESCAKESVNQNLSVKTTPSDRSGHIVLGADMFQTEMRDKTRHCVLLARQLTGYTSRDLAYSSDALDAFRAILTRCRHASLCGVPLFRYETSYNTENNKDMDLGLALGLLWSDDSAQISEDGFSIPIERLHSRRQGFSSWSWASSSGTIRLLSGDAYSCLQKEMLVPTSSVNFWASFAIISGEGASLSLASLYGGRIYSFQTH